MYTSIADFITDRKGESERTAKLLGALTDASLTQSVSEKDRTLGRIAWHLVITIPEMMGRTGLKIASVAEEAPLPTSAKEIAAAYQQANDELMQQVEKEWTDETLRVEDDMYGMKWPRGLTLQVLIQHEIHHRGQMTVLMRQAGLIIPGIYGPAREEWAAWGMNPPQL